MKRILIDLTKCRKCKKCEALCEYYYHNNNKGVKKLIELAIFVTTCRKCEESPCVKVCPQEALEKDENGILRKYNNLCINCKSCMIACPFGTIPGFIFDYIASACDYCGINNGTKLPKCAETCPENAINITEEEPSDEKHIYLISENLLVKDYKWEEFIK